jgi:branched-subunit amino acid ABC-type transport system permease component
VSFEQVEQLTAAGIINGSFYALVGAGFGLILGVTGRFHYAFALVFTLAAYVTSVLEVPAGLPMPLAIVGGLLAAVALGVATERFVYRPLARLTIFISSLGLTIAGINLITLAWTAFSRRSIELVPLRPLNLGAIRASPVLKLSSLSDRGCLSWL